VLAAGRKSLVTDGNIAFWKPNRGPLSLPALLQCEILATILCQGLSFPRAYRHIVYAEAQAAPKTMQAILPILPNPNSPTTNEVSWGSEKAMMRRAA
jgi:hypothetical protein